MPQKQVPPISTYGFDEPEEQKEDRVETKPLEPPEVTVNKETPTEGEPTTTSMDNIRKLVEAVEAEGISPEGGIQFTNRPELLEQGGWILPEGFRLAGKGEQPQGERIDMGEGNFMYYQDPRRGAVPEGQYSYAVMSQLYPEMFEDPKLAPLQEEFQASQERLRELSNATELPKVSKSDFRMLSAIYDEDAFEQNLLRSMGINPYKMDPMGEMNYRWRQQQKQVFEQAFGPRISWRDRSNLNKEELAYWNNVKRQWRADTYNQLNDMRTAKIQEYENAMGNFRSRANTHRAALEKLQKEQKELTKAPQYVKIPNSEGKVTYQYWDKSKRKFIDTGVSATLDDGDLPPDLRRRMRVVDFIKGDKQMKSIASILVAQDPTLKDDPTIQAMLGTDRELTPEMKSYIKEVEEDAISYAQGLMKATEKKTTEGGEGGKGGEGKEEPVGPKEVLYNAKDSEGNDVPVYKLTKTGDYKVGDIVAVDNQFIIAISETKAVKFNKIEDAIKKRDEILKKAE